MLVMGTVLVYGRRVANICPHPETSLSLTTYTIDIWSVEAKDVVKNLVMSKQPLVIRIGLALDISVAEDRRHCIHLYQGAHSSTDFEAQLSY